MCKLCEDGVQHFYCDGGALRKDADPLCDRCLQGIPHKRHDKKAYYSHNRLVIYVVPKRELPPRRRQ